MPRISETLQHVLNAKLPHPTNAGFDHAAWSTLETSESERDRRLFETAAWAAAQFEAFRAIPGTYDHRLLGARLSTLAAVANTNLETHNATIKHGDAMRIQAKASGASDLGSLSRLSAVPILTSNGQSMDIDSYISVVVDAVESWLFDAEKFNSSSEIVPRPRPPGDVIRGLGWHYSLRRAISDLWQQAIWEDWCPTERDGRWFWSPADRTAAERFYAWYQRSMENAAAYAIVAGSDWVAMSDEERRGKALARTVVSVTRSPGRKPSFEFGRPPLSDGARRHFTSLEVLKNSYLADFLHEPFPSQPDLTLDIVHRCWTVLLDVAIQLGKGRGLPRFTTDENLQDWALVVDRTLLSQAFERALALSPEASNAAVELLSWAPRQYKGLWGAPLVPIPETRKLGIVQSVLETGNIVRAAEIWLKAGGLKEDFSKTGLGIRYETNLRKRLQQQLGENKIVSDAIIAPHAIKKSATFPEEIDLLIQWGELLIVGEVKCFFFPADPGERYYYAVHLDKAAAQANRKAAAIAASLGVAAMALGLPVARLEGLKVVPLVVVNQGFGFGSTIDGCLVTEAQFLSHYLGSGSFSSGATFEPSGRMTGAGFTTLYANSHEAWSKFAATLGDPPTLRRISAQMSWKPYRFPDALYDTIWLERQALA